jgi:hypothetical protein
LCASLLGQPATADIVQIPYVVGTWKPAPDLSMVEVLPN